MKVPVLTLLVLLHSIFGISSILFLIGYSFGISYLPLDIIVSLTAISFIIFRRCIIVDLYNYIRDGEKVPYYATDGFPRNIVRKLSGKPVKKDLTKCRLDILSNTKISTPQQYSQKIHYIVINMMVVMTLMAKYRQHRFLPILLLWFFTVFEL